MSKFLDIHKNIPGGLTEAQFRDQIMNVRDLFTSEKVVTEWVYYSPLKGESICITEAPSEEAVLRAHESAKMPCSEILPVVSLPFTR